MAATRAAKLTVLVSALFLGCVVAAPVQAQHRGKGPASVAKAPGRASPSVVNRSGPTLRQKQLPAFAARKHVPLVTKRPAPFIGKRMSPAIARRPPLAIVKRPPLIATTKPPHARRHAHRRWYPGSTWYWLIVPSVIIAQDLGWCHYHSYYVGSMRFHPDIECHRHRSWSHPSIYYVAAYN